MSTNPNSMIQEAVDAAISKRGEIGLQVVAYVDGKQVVDVWGGKKLFGPFFSWPDDTKLREWLQEQVWGAAVALAVVPIATSPECLSGCEREGTEGSGGPANNPATSRSAAGETPNARIAALS